MMELLHAESASALIISCENVNVLPFVAKHSMEIFLFSKSGSKTYKGYQSFKRDFVQSLTRERVFD
jgi:hypothetical protein